MPHEELARPAPRIQPRPEPGLPASANPTNWFIGIGLVVALALGWFSMGQPGRPLQDGNYSCSAGVFAPAGPGATVEGGEVVDVWDFDFGTGKKSLRWRNAERTSPTEFTVTSAVPQLRQRTRTYVCTHE